MSKITLEPNSSGSGTFSIASPNSNINRTLTLPDENGTMATIENIPPGYVDQDALDLFNVTGSAPVYACRAWVNFDGTGAVSIRASGNISSVTDFGTGNYTVTFATQMEDANYIAVVGGNEVFNNWNRILTAPYDALDASSINVRGSATSDNALRDMEYGFLAIFR